MSKHEVNEVVSLNPATTNLILRGKILKIYADALELNDAPVTGGASSALTVITFDPDIAVSTATNKKTMPEVQTAIDAAPSQVMLQIKKTGIGQTANVTDAAAYDFSKVTKIVATTDSLAVSLRFNEGSTIVWPLTCEVQGVNLRYAGTSQPLCAISSVAAMSLHDATVGTLAGASAEFFRVAPAALFFIQTYGTTDIFAVGSYEVIDSRGSTSVVVFNKGEIAFFGLNNVFRNDPSGSGTVSITVHSLYAVYTATHANYTDGVDPLPVTVTQIAENRVLAMMNDFLSSVDGLNIIKASLYGSSPAPYVEPPLPAIRRGGSNEPPTSTFQFSINPADPIQDRQVIMIDASVYVGQIVGGVLSDRVYKMLLKFTRNGAIGSLDKDLQIVSSSPSSGGPACTITAFDDGVGHVGVSVQNNTANSLRIFIDMSARIDNNALRGPLFVS